MLNLLGAARGYGARAAFSENLSDLDYDALSRVLDEILYAREDLGAKYGVVLGFDPELELLLGGPVKQIMAGFSETGRYLQDRFLEADSLSLDQTAYFKEITRKMEAV